MAVYPTFGQDISSTETLLDDIQVDRASNGRIRLRGFYASSVKEYSVVHTLTTTNKDILETFYNTNRNTSFTFTWVPDNSSHTCMFSGAPTFTIIGPGFWTVTTKLVVV
jgi:hypothetical protein